MKRLLIPLLLLPLAAPALGTIADKNNKLTPTEVADGWLLLFDGEIGRAHV